VAVELVPEADPAEREAVARAIAAASDAMRISSPWWRAGLDEALGHAPMGPPRQSGYEAVRSPRRTRGATRA
jgi:hypothetical protein